MSIDYIKLEATARRLVASAGRSVSFIKLNGIPVDAAAPWRGTTEVRSRVGAQVAGDAVSVPPSSATTLGISTKNDDFVERSDEILICVIDANSVDISDFDEVIDEDQTMWKITGVQKLRPATTTLLYFVGVIR